MWGPGRSPWAGIIQDIPAWKGPDKVLGALTCPWAPLLLPEMASRPAHSQQCKPSYLVPLAGPSLKFHFFKMNNTEQLKKDRSQSCWVATCPAGHLEDRVRLDGPDYNHAVNMCKFAAVRSLPFTPRQDQSKLSRKHGKASRIWSRRAHCVHSNHKALPASSDGDSTL